MRVHGIAASATHGGELLDVLVRHAQRRQTDLLRELGEARVCQHGHVTQQLVHAVAER